MNFDPIQRDFNAGGHKAFSDLRELSFIQSSLSRSGNVVSLDDARKHAATLHGSQSGANPGPSNPAGCHISYAREQSAQERITSYAERRG
jgi:hypothetical protein